MKYNSCNWITHGMNFEPGHIEMCCLRCHVGGGNLYVKQPYNGEPLDWDEIFELKKAFVESVNCDFRLQLRIDLTQRVVDS